MRFDRVLITDWSAAARPRTGGDSIWIADASPNEEPVLHNPPTRGAAEQLLRRTLLAAVARGERVLAGFDFPFGFPAGFAPRLGLTGPSWASLWNRLAAAIRDDPASNANNRFEVAAELNQQAGQQLFWGRPVSRPLPHLSSTREGADCGTIPELRACERSLKARGAHPQPVWKLLGAGSVGGQTLTGIPVLHRLRHDLALAQHIRVWPFESQPDAAPSVLLAEVWPTLAVPRPDPDEIRDRAQVLGTAQVLLASDRNGSLVDHLAAPAEEPLAAEEGWILLG